MSVNKSQHLWRPLLYLPPLPMTCSCNDACPEPMGVQDIGALKDKAAAIAATAFAWPAQNRPPDPGTAGVQDAGALQDKAAAIAAAAFAGPAQNGPPPQPMGVQDAGALKDKAAAIAAAAFAGPAAPKGPRAPKAPRAPRAPKVTHSLCPALPALCGPAGGTDGFPGFWCKAQALLQPGPPTALEASWAQTEPRAAWCGSCRALGSLQRGCGCHRQVSGLHSVSPCSTQPAQQAMRAGWMRFRMREAPGPILGSQALHSKP